jgi:hypothetical protein
MPRRFRDLAPIERRLLLEALLVVPVARIVPVRVLLDLRARNRRAPGALDAFDALDGDRIVWAASAVDTRLPRSTCLTRALAASLLLTLHGHPATLRLGVEREDGELAAHAWLESNGRAVVGEAGTFTVLR